LQGRWCHPGNSFMRGSLPLVSSFAFSLFCEEMGFSLVNRGPLWLSPTTPAADGDLQHGGPAAGAVAGEGACSRVASAVAMAASVGRWPGCPWTTSEGHASRRLPPSISPTLLIWSRHGGGAKGLVGVCRGVMAVLRDVSGLFRWRCCRGDGEWVSTMNTSRRQ
jgi:hypothetical protein